MKRKLMTLLTAGAVAATTLGGVAAFANTDSTGDKAEVQAFLGGSQTISAAIGAAEAASGGNAVAAEFDQKDGLSFYEVDTIANGKLISVEIDASSGKVVKSTDEGDLAYAGDEDIVDPAQLGGPLADLVATAEQQSGAKVMAISADHEEGQTGIIEVEIANADGTTQEFAMASDGTMTAIAADQDDDGADEEGDDAD